MQLKLKQAMNFAFADDDDFADFGQLKLQPSHNNQGDVLQQKKQVVYELDTEPQEWCAKLHELWVFDQGACIETIMDFCAKYAESDCSVSSLRQALENIIRLPFVDFLTRCRCAESLMNDFYILEVLEDYKLNPKEDINFTMYAEYIWRMIYNSYIEDDCLESHLLFIITTKMVNWATKFKLFRTLNDVRTNALKCISVCAKSLVVNNPLSNYTVLVMQMFKFDNKSITQINARVKTLKDINIKADILDHLLDYPKFKEDALKQLKAMGQGLKTLDSSQNVHMVTADVDQWLELLGAYEAATNSCETLKEKFENDLAPDVYDQLCYALQRISLDNSVYGKKFYKLSNILDRLVTKIESHASAKELFARLQEELVEMSSTCSRGHLYRLMNVCSGFEDKDFIRLDPAVELKSVINKRVEAYMETLIGKKEIQITKQLEAPEFLKIYQQHSADEKEEEKKPEDDRDLYEIVMDAWMEKDEIVLQKHLYSVLKHIHDEVKVDYVGQGLMSEQDFSTIYRDILNNLFVA